jgi:hypothetical protein
MEYQRLPSTHLERIADVRRLRVNGQTQPEICHLCCKAAWVVHVATQQHVASLEVAVQDIMRV